MNFAWPAPSSWSARFSSPAVSEMLSFGGPALVLKSSGDFDLATKAQAGVAGKLGRRLPIVSHVRSALIVVASPCLDQPLCFDHGSKPIDVQALVTHRSI